MDKSDATFKLIALMVVGSVAKALFGPPHIPRPVVNQTITSAKDLVETIKKD